MMTWPLIYNLLKPVDARWTTHTHTHTHTHRVHRGEQLISTDENAVTLVYTHTRLRTHIISCLLRSRRAYLPIFIAHCGVCRRRVSVCLSVCLCIGHTRYCIKTAKPRITLPTPHDSAAVNLDKFRRSTPSSVIRSFSQLCMQRWVTWAQPHPLLRGGVICHS